jgi:hypothetical protein
MSLYFRFQQYAVVFALLLASGTAVADTAAFDLPGPKIDIRVTRGDKSLPISQVPNLQPGDRLWLHPDLPKDQSAHYLLIVSFLRGSTNPPPESWFTKAETWRKPVREEGIVVTVPQDAQQGLLFLAPETSGDFSSLRAAVRGRPGAFVRASQDLNRASLDRSRLDAYLSAVQQTSDFDPKELHERSVLLARSLSIKLDQQCFDKPTEQQAPCLLQNTDQLVLDDGHSQSMVAALAAGPSADLIGQLSATPTFGAGVYSPYVGAIVDVVRLTTSLHNAEYQYIPALSLAKQDHIDLRLNNPPSFRKPKSVIVVGLPAVQAPQLPPLRSADAKLVSCLQKPGLVLPVEGAPLVFSTNLAHDVVLQLQTKSGKTIDLPTTPDASRGGYAVDANSLKPADLETTLTAQLKGQWGFDRFDGPVFHLQSAHASKWTAPSSTEEALVIGREDVLRLESDSASCVSDVASEDQHGTKLPTTWKVSKPNQVEAQISLKSAAPGPVTVTLKQWGLDGGDKLPLQAYSEAGHLDSFVLHAGDQQATLKGTRLDEIASVEINGLHFVPAELTRVNNQDELRLTTPDATAALSLKSNDKLVAHAALKDGRKLELPTTIEAARPKVSLLSKSVERSAAATVSALRLANTDELPQDGRLSFSLKAEEPATFTHAEKIEVATEDKSFHALLNESDGSLTLQDAHTMRVVFDPLKSFGAGAFGTVRYRPVDANGVAGDWLPLATLVRLPVLTDLRCPSAADKPCTLSGSNLFLIDSVAADPEFKQVITVPEGFLESTLNVPHPSGKALYIKLRDNPSAINEAFVPELPLAASESH